MSIWDTEIEVSCGKCDRMVRAPRVGTFDQSFAWHMWVEHGPDVTELRSYNLGTTPDRLWLHKSP